MNLTGTFADPDYAYGDQVFTMQKESLRHASLPAHASQPAHATQPAQTSAPAGPPSGSAPRLLDVLGTLYQPARLMRASTLLMAGAFAATAALLLVVAGGTWAIFRWQNLPIDQDPSQVVTSYKLLAGFATSLLLVPAFTLGQSAATLATRRQDEQLSTLSLLGAPKYLVTAAALAEPLVAATVGALAGVVGYFVLLAPVSLIHLRGAPMGYVNMILPWWLIAATVVALVLVSMVAAVIGLRRIVISPLGVRTKSLRAGFPWGRIIAGVVLLAVVVVASLMQRMGGTVTVVLAALVTMVMVSLVVIDVLGVLLVRLVARVRRSSSKVHVLVASRLVSAAPKTYWRRVSGLGLTAFIATFCGSGAALIQKVNDPALTGGQTISMSTADLTLLRDTYTGILLTLGIAFTFITVSAIINQSADIFDRASTFRELHGAGMSDTTIKRINVAAVMMPIVWVTALSAGFGMVLAFPMVGMATILAPLSFAVILASVVLGALLIRVGIMVTNPLVRRVTARD